MRYGYGGGRGGGGIRWIIAIIMAVFALVSYYMRTDVNPVTGEKQRVAMRVDQEIALGLQAAPRMAAQMGGTVPDSSPDAQFVKRLGQKLLDASPAKSSPYKFNFHLLADTRTINAFALPGGQIFLTRGLLNKLENEAQVAGVLAHEIGHVIERHSSEHMAKGQLGQMLAGAAGVAASDDRGRGTTAAMAAMMANQMLQLRYGRKDELEADRYGLDYMARAGYDPRQMLAVMRVLAEASKGRRQPEFLATHPHSETRLSEIDRFIREKYPHGIPTELTTGAPLRQSLPATHDPADYNVER